MGGETRRPTLEVESRKIRCKVKDNSFSAKASNRLCMARNSPFLNTLCSIATVSTCASVTLLRHTSDSAAGFQETQSEVGVLPFDMCGNPTSMNKRNLTFFAPLSCKYLNNTQNHR